jgi:hypothetical protein
MLLVLGLAAVLSIPVEEVEECYKGYHAICGLGLRNINGVSLGEISSPQAIPGQRDVSLDTEYFASNRVAVIYAQYTAPMVSTSRGSCFVNGLGSFDRSLSVPFRIIRDS